MKTPTGGRRSRRGSKETWRNKKNFATLANEEGQPLEVYPVSALFGNLGARKMSGRQKAVLNF